MTKLFKRHGLLLVFTVLVVLAYGNSLFNGFVSDDRGILINTPSWNLTFIIRNALSSFRILLYIIIYKLVGFQPFLYHFLNIVFHLGNTILVYLIARRMFHSRIGILAGTIFAIHPLLTESVTWISAGIYAQYSFFFLLSFYLYILSKTNKRLLIFSIISFSLSLLTLEKASILFLVFWLYEICFGNVQKNWRVLSIFTLLSVFYVIGYFISGRLQTRLTYFEVETQTDTGFENPLYRIPIAISSYFFLFVWPDRLTIYQSELIFTQLEFAIRSLIVLAYFLCTIIFFKVNRKIFFLFMLFLIPLIPTLIPTRLTWVVAERYVYLSVVSLTMITALIFDRVIRISKIRLYAILFWIIILGSLSIRTVVRNAEWKNEDTLWIATGKTSPSSPNTHNNLGDVYGRRSDHLRAAAEFQTAIRIKPDYADAHHNLGNAYRSLGRNEDAILQYEKALTFNPTLWQSHQNIAALLYERKDFAGALDHMNIGLAIDPKNPALYTSLGIVYVALGDTEKARAAFEKALALDPKFAQAQQFLQALKSGTLHYEPK